MGGTLIDDIERDALDEQAAIPSVLRKCLALGGQTGSEALRDWATRELNGYGREDSLPEYRVIAAPLRLDGIAGNFRITGQALPPSSLPDVVREHVSERLELRQGVGEIAALARQSDIKLMPPGGGNIARLVNAENDNPYQHVDSVYWAVAHAAVEGVLDQIRTALTVLVAEVRATSGHEGRVPTADSVNHAVSVVVTGKRSKVSVTSAQAHSGTASIAAPTQPEGEDESAFWTTGRRIGAFLVGFAGVAGAVFAGIRTF